MWKPFCYVVGGTGSCKPHPPEDLPAPRLIFLSFSSFFIQSEDFDHVTLGRGSRDWTTGNGTRERGADPVLAPGTLTQGLWSHYIVGLDFNACSHCETAQLPATVPLPAPQEIFGPVQFEGLVGFPPLGLPCGSPRFLVRKWEEIWHPGGGKMVPIS